MDNPSTEKVREYIEIIGFDANPMTGIKGEFYTTNRIEDLKSLVKEILEERMM
jgi:hypothetical protein